VGTEAGLQSSIFFFFKELRAASLANKVLLPKCGKTGSSRLERAVLLG